MNEDLEDGQGKSIGELGSEALWYVGHTFIAIFVLVAVVALMALAHPDPDASGPKALGTLLAIFVPMVAGFLIARSQQNQAARHVWISGLLIFAVACVWVIDLPTGPGLCEHCTLIERLWRTFFDFQHGSGLMGGDGVLVGCWVPLSLIGYAVGARFGLDTPAE